MTPYHPKLFIFSIVTLSSLPICLYCRRARVDKTYGYAKLKLEISRR